MNYKVFLFVCIAALYSCNELTDNGSNGSDSGRSRKLPAGMKYSYDCLKADSSKVSEVWGKADDILNKVATFNIEVTDEEQMKFGDSFLIESVKDKNFQIDSLSPVNKKLRNILGDLVEERAKPTDIRYTIYLLNDTSVVNAYTVGGKIFITTAMLQKCKNDDQLYAIIGHEIGHNEKGHIKATLKQLKASNKFFGEWGGAFLSIKRVLTGSFNQKNELEADYYGLDLSWKLGYDVCAIRSFWDEMAKAETHDEMFDFFRTHPYSDTRSRCLVSHIERNFHVECR
jgi:predicted Zn-dependent protease